MCQREYSPTIEQTPAVFKHILDNSGAFVFHVINHTNNLQELSLVRFRYLYYVPFNLCMYVIKTPTRLVISCCIRETRKGSNKKAFESGERTRAPYYRHVCSENVCSAALCCCVHYRRITVHRSGLLVLSRIV